jgi:DNA-binding NtrC family response regulator
LAGAKVGCLTNLASIALFSGKPERARTFANAAVAATNDFLLFRLGIFDNLAQVAIYENALSECARYLDLCESAIASHHVPNRSWYDLDHQITRSSYYERLGDWPRVVAICDETDPELARRQYKAIRTALLCAKARALAHLGECGRANQTLATAVRACPRGAIDPQIVLEASKGVCLTLQGEAATGAAHFDRALAASRAIGHRYHEAWISRAREAVSDHARVTVATRALPISDTALLLTDVATILGAGHSMDLLAQRTASILQSTALGPRLEIQDESGCEFQPEPSAAWDASADGVCAIQIRGSDRRITLRVRDVRSIDEIALVTSVSDLVHAAMTRTADTENEDDDQTLWPRASVPNADDMVFRSPHMVELLKIAARLALAPLPILITGETGTGKEIIARMIHGMSAVKRGPFIPFNCAATPRDLVESQLFGHRRGAFTGATDSFPGVIKAADHGTLFLDEIGDLDPAVQPKLLRFLENGEIQAVGDLRTQHVSARIVSATNAQVEDMVQQGRFRADLYYRINGARIALPALRDRKDEIPALASLFVARYSRECRRAGLRMADDFVAALLLYDWPGNIRQLANEIRRIVALAADGDQLSSAALSPHILKRWNERPLTVAVAQGPLVSIRLDQPLAQAMDDLEERFIEHALHTSGGRVSEAAEMLGLSRKGLFLKRRRRGMVPGTGGSEL